MEMDWKNGLLFIAAVIIVAVFLIQKFDWIIERLGITSKRQQAQQKQEQDIGELKDHAKKTDENIEKLVYSIEGLQECVHELSDQVNEMKEQTNASERSRLKDRLGQSFRYYNQKKKWNLMEKEAFDDLVKSYEDAGGKNSFVHTVCVPTSIQWEIVDE